MSILVHDPQRRLVSCRCSDKDGPDSGFLNRNKDHGAHPCIVGHTPSLTMATTISTVARKQYTMHNAQSTIQWWESKVDTTPVSLGLFDTTYHPYVTSRFGSVPFRSDPRMLSVFKRAITTYQRPHTLVRSSSEVAMQCHQRSYRCSSTFPVAPTSPTYLEPPVGSSYQAVLSAAC